MVCTVTLECCLFTPSTLGTGESRIGTLIGVGFDSPATVGVGLGFGSGVGLGFGSGTGFGLGFGFGFGVGISEGFFVFVMVKPSAAVPLTDTL